VRSAARRGGAPVPEPGVAAAPQRGVAVHASVVGDRERRAVRGWRSGPSVTSCGSRSAQRRRNPWPSSGREPTGGRPPLIVLWCRWDRGPQLRSDAAAGCGDGDRHRAVQAVTQGRVDCCGIVGEPLELPFGRGRRVDRCRQWGAEPFERVSAVCGAVHIDVDEVRDELEPANSSAVTVRPARAVFRLSSSGAGVGAIRLDAALPVCSHICRAGAAHERRRRQGGLADRPSSSRSIISLPAPLCAWRSSGGGGPCDR
jgi:hypothetical protein